MVAIVETKERTSKGNGLLVLFAAVLLIGISLALTAPSHGAEKFPANPVRVVITHAAGASSDIEFRTILSSLQKTLGVPVVVEFMPGSGGRKSREFVYKAKPDGYTLIYTAMPSTQIGEIFFKGQYNTLKFTYIFSLFSDASALSVKSDSPYKDIADFVEKHKGKTLSCAIPGIGSSAHLNGIKLTNYLKLAAKWVPYNGANEALAALAGGHVDYVIGDVGASKAMFDAGMARPILIFDEKREPRYPDVPTPKDLGYRITVIPTLRGVVGPPGIPADVLRTLESAFTRASQGQEFLGLASKANVRPDPKHSNDFFSSARQVWDEVKGEEENLRSMIKSEK